MEPSLSPADRTVLAQRGVDPLEVRRQYALLASPPPGPRVLRAATLGDGIRRLEHEDHLRLLAAYDPAQRSGRIGRFVPASGAATRMFRGLLAFLAADRPTTRAELERRAADHDPAARDVLRLLGALPRFAFLRPLERQLAAQGLEIGDLLVGDRVLELVRALLAPAPEGLGLADAPKALVPFHCDHHGHISTALEEHVAEARACGRDRDGVTRLHFTVSPQHLAAFERAAVEVAVRLGAARGDRFEIGFSSQDPATDTVALADRTLARTVDGELLFRPGGHGALLSNLQALGGDLVVIKNIDNVLPEGRRELVVRWRKLLGGLLVELETELARRHIRLRDGLADAAEIEENLAFVGRELGLERRPCGKTEEDRNWLLDRLDRPLRVCGVVENRGEPGGGPFWVEDQRGIPQLQIVERAQLDENRPATRAALEAATHFNPVDLACAVRDSSGRARDLARFVDADSAFVTNKSDGDRELTVLEHPGLWNGSMAGWNTVFVEVPAATFAPVKTVFDLLRAEHQA